MHGVFRKSRMDISKTQVDEIVALLDHDGNGAIDVRELEVGTVVALSRTREGDCALW
jgi:hypothetical protein